ncbi:MAG: aminoacyl-tRNA hydrolase [Candidatus Omnitrophica bacterium]|nr:aminoacyl-tRNA hydrolase [Candidatus Omnitrophota bacterium]
MTVTKLVVGLGNPGREYANTRHNIGCMAVEAWTGENGGEFKKCRYASARVAELGGDVGRIICVLPQTYMNNSGLAVRDIVRFDNVRIEDVIVVGDDIRLPFGEMRLRCGGSDGGHNGLKSITACLGTEQYSRLRLGVGAPPAPDLQANYVLAEFDKAEKALLGAFLEEAVSCLKLWLGGEAAKAMTQYNKRKGNG